MLKSFLSALVLSAAITMPALAADPLNDDQQEQVRQLVRDTLVNNPEILMEAMQALQVKQEQAKMEGQKNALQEYGPRIINGPLTPKTGNLKGDVTIVEFFDYQCGYCKRAFPGVMDVVSKDGNIRYVFKELPILSPESEVAARAALAAEKQGKYLELHTAFMETRGGLSDSKIYKIAEKVGLDIDQLKKDMDSDEVKAEIAESRQFARALGISGTPAFIIGDQVIPGAVPPAALIDAVQKVRTN